MVDQFVPPKSWYKKPSGIVVLTLLTLIILAILVFIAFFVFYALKINYGNSSELEKEFVNPKTEVTSNAPINLGKQLPGWQKYIKDFNPTFGGGKEVTIIGFIDFECPKCQEAFMPFKNVMIKYSPVIKVVFKNLPFEKTHPNSVKAANAAACAAAQGKFWEYYDLLFLNKNLSPEALSGYADELGLIKKDFDLCLENKTYNKNINQDLMDAVSLNLLGTPTYLVNGYRIDGSITEKEWDKVITQLLQK